MAQQPPPQWERASHYPGFTSTIRYTTLGITPLDEWSARRNSNNRYPCPQRDSNPQSQKASGHKHILRSARMKHTISLNWRNDMVSVTETKCFQWSINWIFKHLLGKIGACKAVLWLGQLFTGLSSRWPRSISVSPCEVCGERSGTGTGFCLSASVYLCRYHINSPTLHTHLHQKGKRAKPGNLSKSNALPELGENLREKYIHFSVLVRITQISLCKSRQNHIFYKRFRMFTLQITSRYTR